MGSLGWGKRKIEQTLKAFESAWARLQSDEAGWPAEAEDRLFQRKLLEYLRFHKAMLIGEVIPETLAYLRNNPAAEERQMFSNVFVDEYQDLNKAEQELMNLVSENGNKMIIGDEDQSIYENFRNAHPEGIRLFHEVHPDTVDYPLEECRRCPTDLVLAADSFIQNNVNRENRNLIARAGNQPGRIHSVQWTDFAAERDGIVKFVRQRIKEGVNPGKILIMCPRKTLGYEIRNSLVAGGIEAHSFFTEEIFETEESQRAMSLLELLVDQNDRVALRSLLGIGVATKNVNGYKRIMDRSLADGSEPITVLEQLLDGTTTISHTTPLRTQFEIVKAALDECNGMTPLAIINHLFPAASYWAAEFRALWEGEDNLETKSLSDFQKLIRSEVINPEMPLDVDFVRVMSLHKSKGLTAQISIITGVIEGLMPRSYRGVPVAESARLLEEQRRLFFVGITRHTDELVVSSVRTILKTFAYTLGQAVPYSLSDTTRSIASTFLTQMGATFPAPIRGENWHP